MPRRRASKGSSVNSRRGKDSSVKRWNKREDIPLDAVDQFQEQRDKILLEGEEVVPDEDYDDDEVFALKGLAESSEEDEEEDAYEEDIVSEEEEEIEKQKEKKKKKKALKEKSTPKRGKFAESSDEESEKEEEEEEEEEESWGTKKSVYYSSNAALLDSDDEEGHELEEQEARRLQAKLREPLHEEDFGYDEALQRSIEIDDKTTNDFWKPIETPVVTTEMDKSSILRHLEKTSPETLALASEWDDIARSVIKTERLLDETPDDKDDKSLGLIHLFYQTQLTYAALLAFYLHLRASTKYASRPELLRQHPILKRLLTLKQSLITLEDLGFNPSGSDIGSDSDELEDEEELESWLSSQDLELNELQELLAEAGASESKKVSKDKSGKKSRPEQPPKKKKKVAKEVIFDVEEPTLPRAGSSTSSASSSRKKISSFTDVSGFGEASSLDDADAADKGGRRKALRFHTAKIESASARRREARLAVGGDDDIPYRERRKDSEKQKRKNLGAGGDDLDDTEPEPAEQSRKRMRSEESDEGSGVEDDEDGYYSLVKKQKGDKKARKKAAYEALKEANRVEHKEDIADGQRSITRAILKNKGLTPKRGKSVRNPRVKKRQKFEKAKKKVSSQKAVYKGGIGDSGYYGGEMSGISKVIKSVKL